MAAVAAVLVVVEVLVAAVAAVEKEVVVAVVAVEEDVAVVVAAEKILEYIDVGQSVLAVRDALHHF